MAAEVAMANPLGMAALFIVVASVVAALGASRLSPYDPLLVDPPHRLLTIGSPEHILGTDLLGRDVLSRLMYGARLAWMVGGLVGVGSAILGSAIGMIGGYYGGPADFVGSRVVDALVGIPGLLLALVFAAMFGPGTSTAVAALVIVSIPVVSRVVRSTVLVERELDYVRGSRGVGNREIRTLLRHILPNVAPALFVVSTQIASRSILVEASLSFLGVGTQPPTPSWGLMIKEGRSVLLSSPTVVIVPAVVLTVLVLAVNLLSDAVGDWFDPATARGRGRERRA